jgi:hypothetical protein
VHHFVPIAGWPTTGVPPYAPEFYVPPIATEEETSGEEETKVEEAKTGEAKAEELTVGGGAGSEDAPAPLAPPSTETRAADLEGDEHGPSDEPRAGGCSTARRSAPGGWIALIVAVGLLTNAGRRRSRTRGR